MSASLTSVIWERVRFMSPEKIDTCWAIRNELKAMVKMSPTYFALSPASICRATQLIAFCSLKNIRVVKFFRGLDCLTISIAITFYLDDDCNLSRQIFYASFTEANAFR